MLAVLTVNVRTDPSATSINDGDLTLREALLYVNGEQPGNLDDDRVDDTIDPLGQNDRIVFDAGLFDASGQTQISLAHTDTQNGDSALRIAASVDVLEIDGGLNRNVTVSAAGLGARVLEVAISSTATGVTLKNLTFAGGDVSENGGGVRAVGNLALENVSAVGNEAAGDGGGLYVEYSSNNQLFVRGGRFEANRADQGGAMALVKGFGSGTASNLVMSIDGVVAKNNMAESAGGAIYAALGGTSSVDNGLIAIRNSVVRENRIVAAEGSSDPAVGNGGGIFADIFDGRLLIDGASIFDNQAPRDFLLPPSGIGPATGGGDGGGIYVFEAIAPPGESYAVEIVNSTIARNEALDGGGIHFRGTSWYYAIIRHSTIYQNVAGPSEDSEPRGTHGGGIAIEDLDDLEPDQLFLDHSIVTANIHQLKPSDPAGNGLAHLTAEEIAMHQFSPNIGYVAGDETPSTGGNEAQGFVDFDQNGVLDPPFGAPLETMRTSYSHVGFRGVAPFDDVITLIEDDSILAGDLVPFMYKDGEALAFRPVGGFVDAGDPSYVPVTDLPEYELSTVNQKLSLNDIEYDQRDNPFVRIADPAQGPIPTAQIDIGAIEVQPDPIPNPDVAPQIVDVRLSGSSWQGLDYVSMSQRISLGEQYRILAQQDIDTIEIAFTEPVSLKQQGALGQELTLVQTTRNSGGDASTVTLDDSVVDVFGFEYDLDANIGKWTFSSPLPDGKFAIHLEDSIVDDDGNKLDGEWENPHNGTPDDYEDDTDDGAYLPVFLTGNGEEGSPGNEFRFHFGVLAGDFDGDGAVNGGDQVEWQRLKGTNVSYADVEGDGDVDSADLAFWQAQLDDEAILPVRKEGGDFNDNEIVDLHDFIMWDEGFGTEFDGDDFVAWQRAYLDQSAWYVPEESFLAVTIPAGYVTVGLTPQITDVIISGSVSTHDPFSFDTVDGDGAQLSTVPVGGADTISIVFSEDVNVSAEHLIVVGLTTGNLPSLAEFSYDLTANTATWRFEGWALADNYLLSLSDAITDTDGNFLDGEWVNPATTTSTSGLISTFPSGDGVAGGRFNFAMTLMSGDANLDNIVDMTDYNIFLANLNTVDALFTQGDFNGDGLVDLFNDGLDILQLLNLNLQSVSMMADFDGDFDVDDDDLNVIADNFGMTGATWSDGDIDGDGDVDENDLDLAFTLYGIDVEFA